MQAIKQTSPYIRKQVSTKRMMTDVLIALIPVVAFAIYSFGFDAIIRILVSLVTMIGLEALAFGMTHKSDKLDKKFDRLKSRYKDYSINNVITPAISAVIFAMIIPSKLPLYAVVVGATFGIVVGKLLFGGLGSNIFNVAAVGRIFIALALGDMFTGTYKGIDLAAGSTALGTIREGGQLFPDALNSYSILDLFMGNVPGSMGEISALAILLGAAYLLIRRSADYRVMLSAALTFIILIALAGLKLHPDQVLEYTLYHLFAGGLMFGIVFMITDPVTSPVTRPGRWFYGLFVGALVVLIRLFGAYPEGVAFALLFANMFVPLIDYPKWSTNKIKPAFVIGCIVLIAVFGLVVYFGVGGAA
ncbi:MAG: RnfABCDGE type electron transport complex subunit D [Acholeplasmataceae bacterium]|jgi:electron transport complex protein RnfD|nr:RnfABCDGE type electron transport complex subunit D [Acholeplasmataceae bacterium]